jgi:hypothetical protein
MIRHEHYTLYQHQVLEAKLLGPGGLTLSTASEFIENSDVNLALNGDSRKQDCELKAAPYVTTFRNCLSA